MGRTCAHTNTPLMHRDTHVYVQLAGSSAANEKKGMNETELSPAL